jgi:hypothetical protein
MRSYPESAMRWGLKVVEVILKAGAREINRDIRKPAAGWTGSA